MSSLFFAGLNENGKTTARNYLCSQADQIAFTLIEGDLDRMRDKNLGEKATHAPSGSNRKW